MSLHLIIVFFEITQETSLILNCSIWPIRLTSLNLITDLPGSGGYVVGSESQNSSPHSQRNPDNLHAGQGTLLFHILRFA